jgi:asparagine synthase (glutamine-hydrolysing)
MNLALRHRGPDEIGVYSSDFCTLAMSRLRVIDLESGTQPIYNEDRSKCVFFNGEIYNFRELKTGLIEKGHRFSTNSDTEVLVHLYEEYGTAMATYLRGMFAFCILDNADGSLFFARDPFGEKPLYYHLHEGTLTFSSEIPSLLQNRDVPRILNREMLGTYLSMTFVPEPFTLFKDIFSLMPGHTMTLRDGSLQIERYFSVDYQPNLDIKSDDDAQEFLIPFLETAVARQTISDVPLGAFLSGGIDSSTIVALLQGNSTNKIKTFTVKFEEATYDESTIAKEVASLLGTDHHEIVVPNSDFREDLFWLIIDHVGLPFPDSSAIPTYFVTQEIRNHLTVALSGDGGDELFGGYPDFQWWQKIKAVQGYPQWIRGLTLSGAHHLGNVPGFRRSDKLRQIGRALTVANYPEDEFGVHIHSILNKQELSRLLADDSLTLDHTIGPLAQFPERSNNWSSLRKSMYFRLIHNLPLDMLIKVDRMSMANSLEVRAPFLDVDLFSASAQIPDHLLIKDGNGKHIIRHLMRDKLPQSVFDHPKTGFSIPLHHYQNEEFRRLAEELINESNPVMKYFDKQELEKLVSIGFSNRLDNAKLSVYQSAHRLWMVMMLFGWVKRFNVTVD